MRALLRHAHELGVTVHIAYLDGDTLGAWYPELRRVYIDMRLTPNEQRSVLAHELGHARYEHLCDSAGNEDQADRYAARLLIDPKEFAALERINDDEHSLADELLVTTDIIRAFRRHCLTQMRGVTYSHSRMGVGQHAFAGERA